MNKLAAEQNAIVEAMQKIASAYNVPLTYPVAQQIAASCGHSPVLIMKAASDLSQINPELIRNYGLAQQMGYNPNAENLAVSPMGSATAGAALGGLAGGALGLGIGGIMGNPLTAAGAGGLLGGLGGGVMGYLSRRKEMDQMQQQQQMLRAMMSRMSPAQQQQAFQTYGGQ